MGLHGSFLASLAALAGSVRHSPASCLSPPPLFILSIKLNLRVMLGSVDRLRSYHKQGNCTLPRFVQMPQHVQGAVAQTTSQPVAACGEGPGRGLLETPHQPGFSAEESGHRQGTGAARTQPPLAFPAFLFPSLEMSLLGRKAQYGMDGFIPRLGFGNWP